MSADQILQLRDWKEFLGLEGAAAATLMGLLFVAVALNADLILAGDRPHTKLRAEQAFQNYIAVLMISQILLFPHLPAEFIPMWLMTQSAVMVFVAALRLLRVTRLADSDSNRLHHWRRMIPSLMAYAILIYGGREIARHPSPDDVLYIAVGSVILLASATITAWELLVRVAEIRHLLGKK